MHLAHLPVQEISFCFPIVALDVLLGWDSFYLIIEDGLIERRRTTPGVENECDILNNSSEPCQGITLGMMEDEVRRIFDMNRNVHKLSVVFALCFHGG